MIKMKNLFLSKKINKIYFLNKMIKNCFLNKMINKIISLWIESNQRFKEI